MNSVDIDISEENIHNNFMGREDDSYFEWFLAKEDIPHIPHKIKNISDMYNYVRTRTRTAN